MIVIIPSMEKLSPSIEIPAMSLIMSRKVFALRRIYLFTSIDRLRN